MRLRREEVKRFEHRTLDENKTKIRKTKLLSQVHRTLVTLHQITTLKQIIKVAISCNVFS